MAAGEARGWHPRWLHAEQTVWTPIGRSNGIHCALMNEDGMVEIDQGSFSLEPMLWTQGKLHTWTDVTPRQELKSDWMPVPSVIWEAADWRLRVQAEADENGLLRVRYQVTNPSDQTLAARLFVLVRPFQVTPPWQSFRNLGGVSPIRHLAWRKGELRVNGTALIVPAPDGGTVQAPQFAALRFDEGFMASHLQSGELAGAAEIEDSFGFATGALMFDLTLPGHRACDIVLECDGAAAATAPGAVPCGPARYMRPARHARSGLRHSTGAGYFRCLSGQAMAGLPRWFTRRFTATVGASVLVTRSGPALQRARGALYAFLDTRRRDDERRASAARHGARPGSRRVHPLVRAASTRRRFRALLRRQ